jgi:hypothetical protein
MPKVGKKLKVVDVKTELEVAPEPPKEVEAVKQEEQEIVDEVVAPVARGPLGTSGADPVVMKPKSRVRAKPKAKAALEKIAEEEVAEEVKEEVAEVKKEVKEEVAEEVEEEVAEEVKEEVKEEEAKASNLVQCLCCQN